jgi:hypothetical protein
MKPVQAGFSTMTDSRTDLLQQATDALQENYYRAVDDKAWELLQNFNRDELDLETIEALLRSDSYLQYRSTACETLLFSKAPDRVKNAFLAQSDRPNSSELNQDFDTAFLFPLAARCMAHDVLVVIEMNT